MLVLLQILVRFAIADMAEPSLIFTSAADLPSLVFRSSIKVVVEWHKSRRSGMSGLNEVLGLGRV